MNHSIIFIIEKKLLILGCFKDKFLDSEIANRHFVFCEDQGAWWQKRSFGGNSGNSCSEWSVLEKSLIEMFKIDCV